MCGAGCWGEHKVFEAATERAHYRKLGYRAHTCCHFGSRCVGLRPLSLFCFLFVFVLRSSHGSHDRRAHGDDNRSESNAQSGKETEEAEKLYKKFMCYCKTSGGDLTASIEAAEAKIPELAAELEAMTSRKSQLEADLKSHQEDRAAASG